METVVLDPEEAKAYELAQKILMTWTRRRYLVKTEEMRKRWGMV